MANPDNPPAVVTIASANYLPYVTTLMQSVRDSNPSYRRFLVLVDKKPAEVDLGGELFEVIEAADLGIDSFGDMTIRYDVMELNTAVKPFAIEWLFDNTPCSSVIYLDPDIFVYRPLHELEKLLSDGASVVVTPHLTAPVEDGKKPNDEHMLQAGVFNLGFIAVSRAAEAREFTRWWGRRLKEACHADFTRNQFTDQRWIDLAPCYLADLVVLRNPAYNVAYWNLFQRPVTKKGHSLYFCGEELAFFHFSGLDHAKPTVVSKHQNRIKWKDIELLHPLFNAYRQRLGANGWGVRRNWRYPYDWAGDIKITPIVRQLFRELYPKARRDISVSAEFVLAMCNQPARLAVDGAGRMTRLMHKVYRDRPDLQAAFPLASQAGIEAFAGWFEASAEREYKLDPRLVRPSELEHQQIAQAQIPPVARPAAPNQGRPLLYRQWRKARKWMLERI
jgi:hypothetical protein